MYLLLISLAMAAQPQEWRIAVCDKDRNCITSLDTYYRSRNQCEQARKLLSFKDTTTCAQVIR